MPRKSEKDLLDDLFKHEFETFFWPKYPRRVAKKAALKAYFKARAEASCEKITAGLARAKLGWAQRQTEIQFIPHPATWLNQGRYDDELAPTADNGSIDEIMGLK